MRNLAAYTSPGPAPSFVSVNETDEGTVLIVVRSASPDGESTGATAQIELEPEHPIAERFLYPVLSISQHLVKSALGPELDSDIVDEVYSLMPAALRRRVYKQVETSL